MSMPDRACRTDHNAILFCIVYSAAPWGETVTAGRNLFSAGTHVALSQGQTCHLDVRQPTWLHGSLPFSLS